MGSDGINCFRVNEETGVREVTHEERVGGEEKYGFCANRRWVWTVVTSNTESSSDRPNLCRRSVDGIKLERKPLTTKWRKWVEFRGTIITNRRLD